jgi:hypothetical protein
VPGADVKIAFPTPKEWPEKIAPGQENYHAYNKPVSGGAGSASRADRIREAIANDPTPGDDKPATKEGTPNDATPQQGLLGLSRYFTSSPVKSYVREDKSGKKITVNVTEPEHPLHPGYVARIVQETKGGEAVVHNIGEGTGWLQGEQSPFADMINNVWNSQTKDILDRVK